MAELVSEVLVPTENVAEVKRGQQRVSEKRMWPGYILVKMDLTDDVLDVCEKHQRRDRFLGGEKPLPLPQHEIDTILSK